MIRAHVEVAPGAFRLTIDGHAEGDDPTCAAVTALEQTITIMLEQLSTLAPHQVEFTVTAPEVTT